MTARFTYSILLCLLFAFSPSAFGQNEDATRVQGVADDLEEGTFMLTGSIFESSLARVKS